MATKDDRPGLLSKVAKFVRNPTKDWSELDQLEQPEDNGYGKQALKAMIERKRQNDFVRKREFDQLRKLRNRDPAAIASLTARPSFFQTSVGSLQDGRAVTLKKIDEIEAQMSKQWWRGKPETGIAQSGSAQPAPGDSRNPVEPSQMPTQGPAVGPELFAPTEAIGAPLRAQDAGDYSPTLMTPGADQAMAGVFARSGDLASGQAVHDQAFSASELFAFDEELTTDPELEEAAIRFANGDDAGAETGLLGALRGEALLLDTAQSWAAALLDLYRATGQRAQFEHAVREFGARFNKLTPTWRSLSDGEAPDAGTGTPTGVAVAAPATDVLWQCPAVLNLQGMEALRSALSASPPVPWHLDWTPLDGIAADAVPLLDALFASMCNEPVALRFTGTEQLLRRLRALTPSGDRSVDQVCWNVRLNALRAMHLQDEFELAALDYCVTFEVSPPAWVDARCQFEGIGALSEPSPEWQRDPAGPATVSMDHHHGPVQELELRGAVVGHDASAALSVLEGAVPGGQIVVSCRALIRVDFSAAGSILNWVALCQAQGNQVQFRDVHRLVAAFFNVIGINEHARVIPRPM